MVGFNKKTIEDVKFAGKRVLLRADYNVPVAGGRISDDYRIKQSLPTIEYILSKKPAKLIIISHLGRPIGPDKNQSLRPVAQHLGKLLDRRVWFAPDCIGSEAKDAVENLGPGGVMVLENLRFHEGEEKNDPSFAKELVNATKADIFVQDGFGVVHRAHASTDAITKLLPSVSGLLLEKEVATINRVMKSPEKPLVSIIGGAKISDKLEVLHRLIEMSDCVAIGGAMANNFLRIEGYGIGSSLYDKADLGVAKELLKKAQAKAAKQPFNFLLPVDAVVSKSNDGRAPTRVVDLAAHSLSDIQAYPKLPKQAAYTVGRDEAILDIGPVSAGRVAGVVGLAKTIIWNGTLGMAEVKAVSGSEAPFAHGTRVVAEAIIGPHNKHPSRPFSLVGGGDTAAYVETEGMVEDFDHVSTGGGAALELMSGKKLPGVESLQNK